MDAVQQLQISVKSIPCDNVEGGPCADYGTSVQMMGPIDNDDKTMDAVPTTINFSEVYSM